MEFANILKMYKSVGGALMTENKERKPDVRGEKNNVNLYIWRIGYVFLSLGGKHHDNQQFWISRD